VYFFACDCGSKVFFDARGGSWPRHADRCLAYLLRAMHRDGHSFQVIRSRIHEAAAAAGQPIPDHVLQILRAQEYRETHRELVVSLVPEEQEHRLEGRIHSSTPQANFLRRFGYEDTLFGRAFLGDLLNEAYVEFCVRAQADPVSGICPQMECFAKASVWNRLKLHDGCMVAVSARPQKLRRDRKIWVARTIERPNGSK